jgi:hypothetical protein
MTTHQQDAISAATAQPLLTARLRPISGFEEELLAGRGGAASTAALCNEVLARCLVAPGADAAAARTEIARLLVPERDLALMALRRRSFGDRVESDVTCPACGAGIEISFSLADLPLPAAAAAREITVEHDGEALRARLPTAADQERLLSRPAGTVAERRTSLLALVLDAIGDRVGPFAEDDVRALPSAARVAVENALEAALPDVDLSMDAQCQSCHCAFTAPFDLHAFFLPR